jgi:hypothetical protein
MTYVMILTYHAAVSDMTNYLSDGGFALAFRVDPSALHALFRCGALSTRKVLCVWTVQVAVQTGS